MNLKASKINKNPLLDSCYNKHSYSKHVSPISIISRHFDCVKLTIMFNCYYIEFYRNSHYSLTLTFMTALQQIKERVTRSISYKLKQG